MFPELSFKLAKNGYTSTCVPCLARNSGKRKARAIEEAPHTRREEGSGQDQNLATPGEQERDGCDLQQSPLLSMDKVFTYMGIGHAQEQTDCCLHYQWLDFTALQLLGGAFSVQRTDGLWVYEELDRSLVNKLPNKELSESVQRSHLWKQEVEQGRRTTACVLIVTPNLKIIEHFPKYILVHATIPSIEAPRIEDYTRSVIA
jgi:hypothetical protein